MDFDWSKDINSKICQYCQEYDYSLFGFNKLITKIYESSAPNSQYDNNNMKSIIEILLSCLIYFKNDMNEMYYDILYSFTQLCPSINGHIMSFMEKNEIGTRSFKFHMNKLIFNYQSYNNNLMTIENFISVYYNSIFDENNWTFYLKNLIDFQNNSFKIKCLNTSLKFLDPSRFIDLKEMIEKGFIDFIAYYHKVDSLKENLSHLKGSSNNINEKIMDNISFALSTIKSPLRPTKDPGSSKADVLSYYGNYNDATLNKIEELIIENRSGSSQPSLSPLLHQNKNIYDTNSKITVLENEDPLSMNFGSNKENANDCFKTPRKTINYNNNKSNPKKSGEILKTLFNSPANEIESKNEVPYEYSANKTSEASKFVNKPVNAVEDTTFMLSSFLKSSDISLSQDMNESIDDKSYFETKNDPSNILNIPKESLKTNKTPNTPSNFKKVPLDENMSIIDSNIEKKNDFLPSKFHNEPLQRIEDSFHDKKQQFSNNFTNEVQKNLLDENCSILGSLGVNMSDVPKSNINSIKKHQKSFVSSTERIDDSMIGRALAGMNGLKVSKSDAPLKIAGITPIDNNLSITYTEDIPCVNSNDLNRNEISFSQQQPIAASTKAIDPTVLNNGIRKSHEIKKNLNPSSNTTLNDHIKPFTDKFQQEYLEFIKSYFLQNCILKFNQDFDPNQPYTTHLSEIGTFRIRKQVAEGGFGRIFLGYCNGSQFNKICLKVCDDKYFKEIAISRVIQQKHSNLFLKTKKQSFLEINHAFDFKNTIVYVSEWLLGGTLSDLVNFVNKTHISYLQHDSLTIICHELCLIVDSLRKMHIIHLDIKPDNFMLRVPTDKSKNISILDVENKPLVVLIDYGNSVDLNRFTSDIKCLGSIPTKNFACPQMITAQPWTYEPDIFNLGLVIYYLIFKELYIVKDKDNKVKKPLPRHLRNQIIWLNLMNDLLQSSLEANVSFYALGLYEEKQNIKSLPQELSEYVLSCS